MARAASSTSGPSSGSSRPPLPRPPRRWNRRSSACRRGSLAACRCGRSGDDAEIVPVPLTRPWYLGVAASRQPVQRRRFRALSRRNRRRVQGGAARLFGPRAGDANAGIVVTRVSAFAVAELAPRRHRTFRRGTRSAGWTATAAAEIDLAILARIRVPAGRTMRGAAFSSPRHGRQGKWR
jgi:hypothetical protein